jgi:hypothetical protein
VTPFDPQAKRVPAPENPSRERKISWVREYLRGTWLTPKELERVERWLKEDTTLEKEAATTLRQMAKDHSPRRTK